MEFVRQHPDGRGIGVVVSGFDAGAATDEQVASLRDAVHTHRLAVLRDQHLSPDEFLALGRLLGEPVTYYQSMYHHPERPEVFVSSNVPQDGGRVGVPKTGRFWHADYEFMPEPFALTLVYPRVVPTRNRGTLFIDMAAAYRRLDADLKAALRGVRVRHSANKYFKIRPSDVYRPIRDLVEEVDRETPPVDQPAVLTHPVTGEEVLYLSQGCAIDLLDPDGKPLPGDLLARVLDAVGQSDDTGTHENVHLQTFAESDLLVWDNRVLVHRAIHTTTAEPAVSWRVTVMDGHRYYSAAA